MVCKERWIVHEKLWGEFLDISRVVEWAVPLLLDAFEKSVRIVIFAALELYHPLRVLANQEANYISWATVMRTKQVTFLIRQFMVASHEICQPPLIQRSNRLWQVSICIRIIKVQHLRIVVLDHPWVYRILGKIKGAPLCVRVEQRKVLKVAYRTLTPLISVNLDIRRLRFARAWQILLHALIDLITLFLVLEA